MKKIDQGSKWPHKPRLYSLEAVMRDGVGERHPAETVTCCFCHIIDLHNPRKVSYQDYHNNKNNIFIWYSANNRSWRFTTNYNLKDIKRYMYKIRQILVF